MKRLKAIIILAISTSSIIYIGCNSSSAHKNNDKKKTGKSASIYTLGLSDVDEAAILNSARSKRIKNEMDALVKHRLSPASFSGGILLARKGVVIYEHYSGLESHGNKVPVTDSSSFQLASVSKTFTGMAVLTLVEKGKLSLEDPIQKFYPDFPYLGITVRMLLNHRSGLPNYLYFCDSLNKDKSHFLTNEEVITMMTVHKPAAQYQPDRHFNYCNTNYLLLASIIEKASGQKYADYLQTTFFTPLEMTSTFVADPAQAPRPHQTVSHLSSWRVEPDNSFDGVVGDKGIYSTVRDMLKWDQAIYSGKLFKPETLEEAYKPYSNERPGIRNYGLGWRLFTYPDSTNKIVYHNGWWHGNNTVFYRFIKDSTTLVIVGNRYNRGIYQAVKPIREIIGHGDGEEAGEE
ncbi:class A beta-lactamase-related serine hydrolase [Chitinophaga lutea]|uniref:Class A beta-lactamase-related serine hydrolase n=1 Tax=Chitinophaga lutea TaxID=2488634 RepID=A0A3N4PW82_9BACT|nr:serine hydrolase domain-containing protein [Chitinophaga lutea]RPE07990.1 class A beta-lactamase-related serine hydrolase [Chitinophaga lutea]